MSEIRELKEILETTFFKLKEDVDISRRQIDVLMDDNRRLREEVSELSRKVESNNEDKLKKEVMHKFRRHKKEMIKHKIVETARLKRMTLPELKEIIVDQMGYCSKATFYRYYDELRKEGTITIQNKIIISNVLSIV